jgi:hypothetical protein
VHVHGISSIWALLRSLHPDFDLVPGSLGTRKTACFCSSTADRAEVQAKPTDESETLTISVEILVSFSPLTMLQS